MAQLAIKGHATRGKEVIEILEMLGGKNKAYLNGTDTCLVYYICLEGYIDTLYAVSNKYKVFTLEAFLEKFPYKVWDKVSILEGTNYVFTIKSMTWDTDLEQVVYKIKSINDIENEYDWLADELLYYTEQKEEPVENKGTLVEIDLTREESKAEEIEVILGDYEFVLKDGKTYFVKKKPQYPKTYVECAKILDCFGAAHIDGYKGELLDKLQELLICRDAYWKIAGGWKFDFDKPCYYLCNEYGSIQKFDGTIDCGAILTFPTKEMRDAFYENFKELIEECKEFL